MMTNQSFIIDGATYDCEIIQQVNQDHTAPKLVIVSYLPNDSAIEILRACIDSIQHFTTIPYELWVVDNASPNGRAEFLRQYTNINIVYNHRNPSRDHLFSWHVKAYHSIREGLGRSSRRYAGSYANGIALEIGARCIHPQSEYMMTLHMDTMAAHHGWLAYLISKLDHNIKASGTRQDTVRVPDGILHVVGYVFSFPLFRSLNLSFLPDLPALDVGDKLIVDIKRAGHEIVSCKNTHWYPELIERIPSDSPLYELMADRSFDDDGNVIFLHLGRGIKKSRATEHSTLDQWLALAEQYRTQNTE